jgi:hypothetical protein
VLPNFVVIGAMKAGTTSLYEYLRAHPEIFMATPKELHFFAASKNWKLGPGWYEAKFAAAGAAVARGEISPSYSQADVFPGVAERVHAMLPGARIVYLVREPIARLQSMYLHQIANGRERRPIVQAVREHAMYVNASRYAWQLDFYLAHYPREQIHVLATESMRSDRDATLSELYRFLGVDPGFVPPSEAERGRTEDKRVRSAGLRRVTRLAPVRAAARLVPAGIRRRARTLTTSAIDPARAELPDDLVAELRERLAPDVARLEAEFLPPDFPFW